MLTQVGERIELLQCEQGLSTNEVAKRAGLHRQRLWRIKRSKRLNPVTVNKLSKAFRVPVSYFVI